MQRGLPVFSGSAQALRSVFFFLFFFQKGEPDVIFSFFFFFPFTSLLFILKKLT